MPSIFIILSLLISIPFKVPSSINLVTTLLVIIDTLFLLLSFKAKLFSLVKSSKFCITITSLQISDKDKAFITALLPPPITATFLSLKNAPSHDTQKMYTFSY